MRPAYLANMAPPFTRFWRGWNRPINRKWLGEHKTVMGLFAGLMVAMVTTFVQSKIHHG
jgi:CDP-2,3-bis-(O-geranylgeranyl)-sn-glycerol synthase